MVYHNTWKGGTDMTTIGDRIKMIRMQADNGKKLTLEKFGSRVFLTNQAISAMEAGRINPSDQTIALICQEFNINRDWLVSGDGEMYNLPLDDEEAIFQRLALRDEVSARVLKMVIKWYTSLDEAALTVLDEMIEELLKKASHK